MDYQVLEVQQWLNLSYGNRDDYKMATSETGVPENGQTGWDTIYGLIAALQIELNVAVTGWWNEATYAACPSVYMGEENNLVYIIQGGLWCKGYNPGGFTGYYGQNTYNAVYALKTDAGFPTATGNMVKVFMRALLDMSAFTVLDGGKNAVRKTQQYLNYNFYEYFEWDFGLVPCDGILGRTTALAFIYGLQAIEGMSIYEANGIFGPGTCNRCPTVSIGETHELIILMKHALGCNGYNVEDYSNLYDRNFNNLMVQLGNDYILSREYSSISVLEVKQLLTSNGYPYRSSLGCDCSTVLNAQQAQDLKNAGYQYVGRYLTGTVGMGEEERTKALTLEEIQNLENVGLKTFLIYQDGPANINSYTTGKGFFAATKAILAAKNIGAPNGAYIYFAVDFDCYGDDLPILLSYFSEIKMTFNYGDNRKHYRIGIYAPRYMCQLAIEAGYAGLAFVSDMSYGFSGNLGYQIPKQWAFDQFFELRNMTDYDNFETAQFESSPPFDLDKVAVSGKDEGILFFDEVDALTPEELEQQEREAKEEIAKLEYLFNALEPLGLTKELIEKNISFSGESYPLTPIITSEYVWEHSIKTDSTVTNQSGNLNISLDSAGNLSATTESEIVNCLSEYSELVLEAENHLDIMKSLMEKSVISAKSGNVKVSSNITNFVSFNMDITYTSGDIYVEGLESPVNCSFTYSVKITPIERFKPLFKPKEVLVLSENICMAFGIALLAFTFAPEVATTAILALLFVSSEN